MPYVYDKNGNPVYVKPEDMLNAVEQRLIQLPANKRLYMVDENTGDRYTIPLDDLHQALRLGWRMEEENERVLRIAKEKYGDDEGLAALVGVSSGLSAGLSDMLFEGAGVEVDQLKAANPTISTVMPIIGAVGGALGPGLALKGAGLAARGAGAIVKGATASGLATSALKTTAAIGKLTPAYNIARLGTTTAQAAKGALLKTALGTQKAGIRGIAADALLKGAALGSAGVVEGGLYGVVPTARDILSEESLGNLDGVAETLISQVGAMALIGGAAGGVFGVGGALGGRLLKGTSEKLTSAIGTKFGPEAAEASRRATLVKTWGIPESKLRKMGDKKVELWEEVLFDERVLPDGAIVKEGLSTEQILDRATEAAKLHGGFIGAFTNGIDDIVSKARLPASVVPDTSSFVVALNAEVSRLTKGIKTKPVRELIRDLEILRKDIIPGPLSFKETQEFKVRLQDVIDTEMVPGKKMSSKGRIYIQLKNELANELEAKIDTVLIRVSDLPKTAAPVSLDDIDLPPELDEIVSGKLNQISLLKEHYTQSKRIYGGLTDALRASKKEMVAKAGEDLSKGAIQYGVRGMGWRLLGNTSMLSALARTGASMGFYYGGRLIGRQMGLGAAKDIGTHLTRLNKAAKFGTITKRMESFQAKVDSAIDKILKPDVEALRRKAITPASVGILRTITGEKDREKALEKYVNTLASYNADPMYTADGVSASLAELEEIAPQLAEKMATLTSNTLAYLLKFAPKRTVEPSLQPLLEKPSYSRKEISRFERIIAAVKDPVSVLLKVSSGMVTKEEIQVLKDLYPTIFEAARLQVSMKAAETKKLFSNAQKRRLSLLFDIPLDRTARPGYLNRGKAVYAPKEEARGKGVSGVSLKGLRKLDDDDLPKMAQTTTQRIEGEL